MAHAPTSETDYLRGDLPETLDDGEERFGPASVKVLKFHGVYQQDDRDTRRERAKAGLGKDWLCMVRAGIPGGVLRSEQYLVMDRLAAELGNGTLRVTTRQAIQFHFTRKRDLKALIGTLNRNLVTTLAGCGDVVRNVVCSPAPLPERERSGLLDLALELSRELKPRTDAYWQLWVDGERIAEAAAAPEPDAEETEPLYGPSYLPRKFKIGIAWPGDNDVDVYTHDVGIVPHLVHGRVDRLSLLVGGGLGMTHNNPATYPKLAEPLGVVEPERLIEAVKAIIRVQRDHGDRSDRKHARMKYLIAERGIDWFREQVEFQLDRPLAPPEPLAWPRSSDHLGWFEQSGGRWFLGVRLPSGRIDDGEVRYRTALRLVAERHAEEIRFTPAQDVLLCGIAAEDRDAVDTLLREHGVPLAGDLPQVQRAILACPALPTCGLALTEAERVAPAIADGLQAELDALGLGHDPLGVRVTGCPNGCARPYSTEVGVVGRGAGRYALFLAGAPDGTRLNEAYADHVALDDIPKVLRPVLAAWALERGTGERFGDYCHRLGLETLQRRFPAPQDRPGRARSKDVA